MEIITKTLLDNMSVGDIIKGAVFIQDYQVLQTRNGSDYIDGVLCAGKPISFKIWTSPDGLVEKLKSEDYRGCVCNIYGKLESYNGLSYLIVKNTCDKVNEPIDIGLFLPIKYDKDAFLSALKVLLSRNLSPEGIQVANKLLFDNEKIFNRFVTEFCAKSHHDNCLNGLLVHTYKIVDLLCFICSRYGYLSTFPSRDMSIPMYRTDLLIIGGLIHDWGKIEEMQYGVYQPNSAVTHRVFGIEMLFPFKDYIISVYDEKWYYDLVSIISQHHGEFGEDCKTIYSYVVHQVDMLDTMLTGLSDTITNNLNVDNSGNFVYVDKKRLNL